MNVLQLRMLRGRIKPSEDPSHESGVTAYETGDDLIAVRFRSGDIYIYDYPGTGRLAVEIMKRLAVSGQGLSTHISREIKGNDASRI